MTAIQRKLYEFKDSEFKDFQAKLLPTVEPEAIIGVRVPILRKLAVEIAADGKKFDVKKFLDSLPHKFLEENFLHSFIIEKIKDYDECIYQLKKYLPFVDNWAVCDTFRPRVFKKNADKILVLAEEWLKSTEVYVVRYGISIFMTLFLNEKFRAEYLYEVASVNSAEYNVNMMQAWYFATALAKQWDYAIKIIEGKKLSPWVHNKTIQKAKESLRISDEHKKYLEHLKIK